jgi:hypothetical protein
MKENRATNLLRTLASQGDERMVSFERRYSLATVVSVIGGLPSSHVDNAISFYQKIIRNNIWYFPVLSDVDLALFLVRWGDVHATYFKLATEIFTILAKGEPLSTLATSFLITRVIQSETMRGWVGKRSPSGLDALLDARTTQINELLAQLGDDAIEDVLSYGGIYIENPQYITAEREIINFFNTFHHEVGRELTIDMLNEPNRAAQLLLRDYCHYSIDDFNKKYRNLCVHMGTSSRVGISANNALNVTTQRLNDLTDDKHSLVQALLDEIKMLNHLNLNLEVKYSFKGWAGLMHVLVFIACRDATGIDDDVYAMRNVLIKREEGKKR